MPGITNDWRCLRFEYIGPCGLSIHRLRFGRQNILTVSFLHSGRDIPEPPHNLLELQEHQIIDWIRSLEVIAKDGDLVAQTQACYKSKLSFTAPKSLKPKAKKITLPNGDTKNIDYPRQDNDSKHALRIDATWSHDGEGSRVIGSIPDRYLQGPRWKSNSCAFDSTLMLALFMEVGRVECDQLPLAELAALPQSAQVLRRIISLDWSRLSLTQLDFLRDCLKVSVQEGWTAAGMSFKANSFFSVGRIFADICQGARQCQFWAARACWCSNCKTVGVSASTIPRPSVEVLFDQRVLNARTMSEDSWTMSRLIGFHFGPYEIEEDPFHSMPVCAGCGEKIRHEVRALSTRLPHRLVLGDGWDTHEGVIIGSLGELNIEYYTVFNGHRVARYRWQGAIVYEKKGHFWVLWQLNPDVMLQHDAMRDDGVVEIAPTDIPDGANGIAMLVYTLVDDKKFEQGS